MFRMFRCVLTFQEERASVNTWNNFIAEEDHDTNLPNINHWVCASWNKLILVFIHSYTPHLGRKQCFVLDCLFLFPSAQQLEKSQIREACKQHIPKRKGPTLSRCWSNVLTHSFVFMVHSLRRPSEPLKIRGSMWKKRKDGHVEQRFQ